MKFKMEQNVFIIEPRRRGVLFASGLSLTFYQIFLGRVYFNSRTHMECDSENVPHSSII